MKFPELPNTANNTVTITSSSTSDDDIKYIENNKYSPRCEKCNEIIFSIPRMGIFHYCKGNRRQIHEFENVHIFGCLYHTNHIHAFRYYQ